jgi:hypothetical protein
MYLMDRDCDDMLQSYRPIDFSDGFYTVENKTFTYIYIHLQKVL